MACAPPDAVLYHSWPQPDGTIRLEYLSEAADELLEATADELARLLNTRTFPLFGTDLDQFWRGAEESFVNHTPWRAGQTAAPTVQ